MKLEQSDKNFLFSETKLPDVFFTEYMSQANGDYIKVYLYIVFLSKYNKEVKINDVSKTLNIPCLLYTSLNTLPKTGFF